MMQELAQATFTYEQFPEVMSMLWKRMLQENKRNWRRTYKVNLLYIFFKYLEFFYMTEHYQRYHYQFFY